VSIFANGSFSDPRIRLTITQSPDQVAAKLPALLEYQLSLRAPEPPPGSFNPAAAKRGETLFGGAARCATCHTPPTFTDVVRGPDAKVPLLHAPSETGAETVYASRTATKKYRTAPLRGVWQHPPYFHDGSAADLLAVVNRYDKVLSLGLTAAQKADLVEYLKSL
jgi:mono/diheme cytochrome c family protein